MTNKTQKTYYIVYFEIIYNTISNLKGSIINTNLSKKELLENFLKGNNVIINIIELGELKNE